MQPPPPSLHANFFSSLKRVEKRLKLECPSRLSTSSPPQPQPYQQENSPSPPVETDETSTFSLSSPIYLGSDRPINNSISTIQDSEPPGEFLSNSLDFLPIHENPAKPNNEQDHQGVEVVDEDCIALLIQQLGLSDSKAEEPKWAGLGSKNDEFLDKIVGMKGPKCDKEADRLEGWIKHYLNDGGEGKREPLRLAHLLLAKATLVSDGSDEFGVLEFPSTVEEFLKNDPPRD